jgi:hypothetical protein
MLKASRAIIILSTLLLVVGDFRLVFGQSENSIIRGRVMYGSKPVEQIKVRLAEPWEGILHGAPEGIDTYTEADGSFVFRNIKLNHKYVIVVFEPTANQKVHSLIEVTTGNKINTDVRTIDLTKHLNFTEPANYSYFSSKEVAVAWTGVAEAAFYKLTIVPRLETRPQMTFRSSTNRTVIELPSGEYCSLRVEAFDKDGALIGTSTPSGKAMAAFYIGVADEKSESELSAASGDCKVTGDAKVYIKPIARRDRRSPYDAPFVILGGDEVRLIGALGEWRKIKVVTGPFPGKIVWIHIDNLICKTP